MKYFKILSVIPVILSLAVTKVWAQEPYAVLSDNNTVLTFYYDDQKDARGGMSVGPFIYDDERWNGHAGVITTVVFDDSFADCTTLTSTARWFHGCSNLTSLSGIENLNTSNVTDMSYMFYGCSGLTSLDVSGFNTEKVTGMSYMFRSCSSLTILNVGNFNTSNVTNMNGMFKGCYGLANLDLSNFNTANVTHMTDMFALCSNLSTIYVSDQWSTAAVTEGNGVFSECTNLVGGAGTTYDPDHTDYTYAHIDGGTANPGYFTAKDAPTEIYAPYFNFEGDNLTMTSDTQGAIIFYAMEGYSTEDEANDLRDNMTVDTQNTLYQDPIPVTTNVVVKAIAFVQGQGMSDVTTLVYDYDAWQGLLQTMVHGEDVLSRSDITMPNDSLQGVLDDLRNDLTWMLDESRHFYQERAMMDSYEANHFAMEIQNVCNKIEELLNEYSPGEPYAVLSDNNTVLTFYYDGQKDARGGMSVGPFLLSSERWNDRRDYITTVVFDDSFAGCTTLTSTAYWFDDCPNLTSIEGIINLKTANVTDMSCMFADCHSLTSLDLSSFNTASVTGMGCMFRFCLNLTSLDLSSFNTANVTDMYNMFYGCNSLTSLDVSGFNTENVTNMDGMFHGCSGLTSLDVSGFITGKVTNMRFMFEECSSLTSLDVSGFNTANVTDMEKMFYDCSSLASLDVSGFNTSNVSNMNLMFYGCSGLKSLDVSSFNTSNVTEMNGMFQECSGLTSLDLGNFNTENVTNMGGMFYGCSGLTSLDVSNFNTEKVGMMDYMFYGCSGLTSLDVSNFNTENVWYMWSMFGGCSGLTSLDVSNFNTENVRDMHLMFYGCSNLSTIYVSDQWSTVAVTNGVDMFKNCTNLVGGAGTTYDPDHMDYTYAHIDGGVNNPGYFTSKDAPTEIYAPYFNFEGDNLTMTSDTQGAIIFYAMEGYSTEDEANDLRDNMTVDTQNTLYQDPIPVTTNVVVKAIAFVQGQGMSDVTTLVYDYDAWQGLLQTMVHGEDVLSRSDITMPNDSLQGVLDDLRNDLTWMLDESRHFYQERAMMDSYEANHFAMEIQNVCNKIEELLNEYSPSEPYAVLSDNNTVLTFYYDDQKDARGGMSVGPFGDYPDRGWNAYSPDIQRVVFSDSFADYRPEATNHWFYNMNNLTVIEGIENLHTERVESMQGMFHHCYNLQDLDVSGFNTMSVTNMWGVFEGCRSLTTLDVSSFDTSNAVTMESMFRECSSLTTLDLRGFHPANVTNFYAMFKDCSSLVSVDLRNFNTLSVSNWELFFDNCSSLSSIQASYANIPQEVYASIENPNLLVYVNEPSLAPQSVTNVVVDGHAPLIVLTDTEDGNNNWYCPEPFYADSIVYTHDYRMTTQIGVSRGWETIALPFNVQNIRHEKNGALAPFGSGLAGKPFWLRTLSHQGLMPAERIEANVPYLISMPNNALYLSEYNQAGTVTFSASNTEVYMTEQWGMESNDRVLMPAFQRVAPQSDVFAVNRNAAYGNYPEGSVFVAGYREVRPFEAYTLHPNGGAKLLTIDDLMNGDTDDIDIQEMVPADNVKVYDLSGVLIKSGNANEVMKQLPRGIYIVNGMKVVK